MRVGNCLEVLLIHHYAQINRDGHGICLFFYFTKGMMKGGNKQEDAWINPFVKQFSNISFSRDSPEENVQSNKMDLSGGRRAKPFGLIFACDVLLLEEC